jgi:hypothetical protein
MKIIKPSVDIMTNIENPQKHIESIARTCYKSNDLITEDSHKKFISSLVERKHWAMLEHFIFIYQVNKSFIERYIQFANELNLSLQYMKITNINDRYVISFSARTLLDLYDKANYCDASDYKVEEFKDYTRKLIKQCVHNYDCYELFKKQPHAYIYFTPITLDQL